ncbi:MAG: MBL fold metallo-hydrolase [Victivallales bacterium]|jgi:glyoxylase-like metal-dependent hydrolase (beta-lactamase superfamily II)|nr:MBL fold metallo-hydrolase [Victivallales bacterium]
MSFLVKQLRVGGYDQNFSYLIVADNGDAALVDPTGDCDVIRRAVKNVESLKARYILLTHGHQDHCECLGEARGFFPAEVASHSNHPLAGEIKLHNGQKLPFGDGWIEVLSTPGHSRDSLIFRLSDDSALFTGDTLFVGCIGFCRSKEMFETIKNVILPLPDKLMIYPGHDYGEVSCRTLGEEKTKNPYLRCTSVEEFRKQLKNLE